MSPKRGTISISRACYDRLKAYADTHDIAIAAMVEELLDPDLARVVVRPRSAPAGQPRLAPPDRAMLDRIAAARRTLGLGVEVLPSGPQSLNISPVLSEAIHDQVQRARAAGLTLHHGEVLDAAINRMLDELSRLSWCRKCLETPGDCRCPSTGTRTA